MIPYYIKEAHPNDCVRSPNIITQHGYTEKQYLHDEIIRRIIEVMYEFCSKEYGHGINILSYDDYCEQYWKIAGYNIHGRYYVFDVYYFDKEWIKWDIGTHKKEIYNAYVKKYTPC